MSMSEFEEQENSRRNDLSSLSTQRRAAPEDFTDEDLAFVEELKGLFSPEDEELPPYYAQTLLEAEDPRFDPAEYCFELRTSARVFRKLELRRRLFGKRSLQRQVISSGVGEVARHRPFLAMVAMCMLVMLFTVAFTGESFASGVVYLLQGGGSGVYEVFHYPEYVTHTKHTSPETPAMQSRQIPFQLAKAQLNFNMYLPLYMPQNYSLQSTSLYQGIGQNLYASGQIMQLEYDLAPAIVPQGTGQIVILEFKPKQGENVLQMVQDGAAHPIDVGQNGQPGAIYVDGQWTNGRGVPQWVTGGRSELIYQQDGVVFWIVGDQRDGIQQKELMNIAGALQIFHPPSHVIRTEDETNTVTQMATDLSGPFVNDVFVVNPDFY